MNLKSSLIKIFNLEKGEEKIVLLIIIYSFFMGAAIAYFVSSATSLFLSLFNRQILPVAFIASGLIVYLIGIVFSKLQQSIRFSKLINFSICFLFISSGVFLVFYLIGASAWVVFMLYAWIRVFAYIHSVTFWGLASKLFSLRQGKRIFGLIGSGEVISSIISYFSLPVLLTVMKTEDLLYIANACLIVSFFFMMIIIRQNKSKLSDLNTNANTVTTEKIDKKGISFFQNKYFTIIFFITLFPVIGQLLVEFIFQSQSKIQFPQKEALTGFLGIFFGFTSIIEFALKTFFSGRLISRYGIRLGLIVFPLMIVISFTFASLTGSFDATLALFFPFVALGRLFTRAARTSFNDPSVQILFQPIPSEIRLAFQGKIEGGPKAFGNIVAGIIILLLSYLSFLNLVHFSYILLALVLVWLKLSIDAYKEYKKTIQEVLNAEKIVSESEENIINENSTLIKDYLKNTDEKNFFKNVSLAKKIDPLFTKDFLAENYFKSDEKLKKLIVEELITNVDIKQLKLIIDNIENNGKSIDSDAYQLISEKYNYFSKYSYDDIVAKSDSENENDRIDAARMLRFSKRFNSYKIILKLLNDKKFTVKSEAIITAGVNKHPDLWLKLIDLLKDENLKYFTVNSLINIGDPVLKELEKFYNKNIYNPEIQLFVIFIISSVASKKSLLFLRKLLKNINVNTKNELIRGIKNIGYLTRSTETQYINIEIEETVEFIVWICAAIDDVRYNDKNELTESLQEEFLNKKEFLFDCLSIIYGKNNIDAIQVNLSSNTTDNKGYALEILDMIFPEETKNLLLPLFENNTENEVLISYKTMFPQIKMSFNERISDIINKDYTKLNLWVKSKALKYLIDDYSIENEKIIISNIPNPNTILKEIAASELLIADSEKLLDQLVNLKNEDRINYKELKNKNDKTQVDNNLFIYEKVEILKSLSIFKNIYSGDLINIASNSYDFFINQNKITELNYKKYLFYVVNGEFEINYNNQIHSFHNDMLVDFTSDEYNNFSGIRIIKATHLLAIDYNRLLSRMKLNSKLLSNFFEHYKTN